MRGFTGHNQLTLTFVFVFNSFRLLRYFNFCLHVVFDSKNIIIRAIFFSGFGLHFVENKPKLTLTSTKCHYPPPPQFQAFDYNNHPP